MDKRYRYYAIVTEDWPIVENPSGVARQWTDENGRVHEEAYTQGLVWASRDIVERVRSGHVAGEVHLISEETGLRFEEVQAERVRAYAPTDGRYSYFALVTDRHPLDDPIKVIRTWTSPQDLDLEETCTHASGWALSHVRYRVSSDRENGDLVPITEEAAKRVKLQTSERVERNRSR